MAHEIERKFLVNGDYKSSVRKSIHIIQGYLSTVPERTVRIRIKDGKGSLTVKGAGSKSGISRFEWEIEIKKHDAENLLEICGPGVIEKTRNIIEAGAHFYEVDEFHGENEGLVLAEIELNSEDEDFIKPDWLGKEVSGSRRYYNSMLVKNPYKKW